MRVIATAHIRNEDMRRLLKKDECVPGDVLDLEDALAEVYLKNGWVVPAGVEAKPVEVAAHTGAPERAAVTRRAGMTKSSVAPKVKDG